jgi:hypothetical protein
MHFFLNQVKALHTLLTFFRNQAENLLSHYKNRRNVESGQKKAAKFAVHLVKCKLLCQCPFHGSIVGVFSIKFALLVRYCLVIVMFSSFR